MYFHGDMLIFVQGIKEVSQMTDERRGKDRRSNKDRRNGDNSSYNGPEKRSNKYRRSDKDRRDKQ